MAVRTDATLEALAAIDALYRSCGLRIRCRLKQQLRRWGNNYGAEVSEDSSEAEDLTQEVFLKLLTSNAGRRLQQGHDPLPYISAIAKNLCVDRMRRQTRRSLQRQHYVEAFKSETNCSWCVERMGQRATLRRYIACLSTTLCDVYEARFVTCLSERATACQLGITRRQVRAREQQIVQGALQVLTNDE